MYNYWSHFKMRSRDLINLLKPLAIIKMKKEESYFANKVARARNSSAEILLCFFRLAFRGAIHRSQNQKQNCSPQWRILLLVFPGKEVFLPSFISIPARLFYKQLFILNFFQSFPTRTTISTTTPSEQILSVIPVYNKSRYQSFYKKIFFSSNQ